MLEEIRNVKNIFIFFADSLRFDYLPADVAEMGIPFKTVASSLYTASSFASIVSGLYPPGHGVFCWEDQLSEENRGLLSLEGFNVSLWCETTWTHLPPYDSQIHSVLGNPKGIPLEEIESPFIYIEDDKGGHCPYGFSFGEFMGAGCPDFFYEYGRKGKDELINQYKKGIRISVRNFKKRLNIIQQRGIMNETLVIFSSDHGELLGEYGGLTGHGELACPEVVYVPTVFIHPSLNKNKSPEGIIRHVDLLPTINYILNIKNKVDINGVNIIKRKSLPSFGFNFRFGGYYKKDKLRKFFSNQICSIWDYYGGFVFNKLSNIAKIKYLYKFLIKHPSFYFMFSNNKGKTVINKYKNFFKALKYLSRKTLIFNNPRFEKSFGRYQINKCIEHGKKITHKKVTLDYRTRKILKDLGYFD